MPGLFSYKNDITVQITPDSPPTALFWKRLFLPHYSPGPTDWPTLGVLHLMDHMPHLPKVWFGVYRWTMTQIAEILFCAWEARGMVAKLSKAHFTEGKWGLEMFYLFHTVVRARVVTGTQAIWLENLLITLSSKWNVAELTKTSNCEKFKSFYRWFFSKAQNSRDQDPQDSSNVS